MTDALDIIFGDDEAHVLRTMMKRIEVLEKSRVNEFQPGMITDWGLITKSGYWSTDRPESVGSKYTRWWKLDDINETGTYAELSGNSAWEGAHSSSGTEPEQGQIGGQTSQGSYGVKLQTGDKNIIIPNVVAMGTRGWSMEATFRPDNLPGVGTIYGNGLSTGQAMRIENGSGLSGSLLCLQLPGVATYSTGITLVEDNWYHAIFVSKAGDSKFYWHVGRLDPITKAFTYQTGSVAVGAAITPATSSQIGGGIAVTIDNVVGWQGEVGNSTNLQDAEDRVRNAVQPHSPKGFIPCDGAEVARNRYDRLFQIYGTTFGAGDGSTTFNLPNYPGAIVKV